MLRCRSIKTILKIFVTDFSDLLLKFWEISKKGSNFVNFRAWKFVFFFKQVRSSPEKDWCSHPYPYDDHDAMAPWALMRTHWRSWAQMNTHKSHGPWYHTNHCSWLLRSADSSCVLLSTHQFSRPWFNNKLKSLFLIWPNCSSFEIFHNMYIFWKNCPRWNI